MINRLFLILLVPLSACGQSSDLHEEVKLLYRNTVPVISTTGLDSILSSNSNLILLDTREKLEFDVSHLPGSTLAAYSSFSADELKNLERSTPIVVYCTIGYRSERIGEKLKAAGFTNVHNLYGGIFHYKNEGGIVVTSSNDTTDKVHTYNKQWSRFLEKGEKVY